LPSPTLPIDPKSHVPLRICFAWSMVLALVSPTHLPCLRACLYESVSCVYVFFSTCRSTCVARAACFVFCSIFISTFLLVIRMNLIIWMSSFSMYMCIILIPAYVWIKNHTHSPPFPYWYTFTDIVVCIFGVMSYTYTHVSCVIFFFVRNSIDTCVKVSIDVRYPSSYPNPLITSVLQFFNLYIHQSLVLLLALVLQTMIFTIPWHKCEYIKNSTETWLQSQDLII